MMRNVMNNFGYKITTYYIVFVLKRYNYIIHIVIEYIRYAPCEEGTLLRKYYFAPTAIT